MRAVFFAALVVAATAVAPAYAEIYDNKSLPTYAATPNGFTIRPAPAAGYDLVLHIDPVGDFPRRPDGESRLCDLRFQTVPSKETQQWFNARWKDESLLEQARSHVARLMKLTSEETFALGDVVGMEYVGRQTPTAVTIMSLALTPRGRLLMNCVLRADEAAKALPIVRAIRDTIRPPG